PTRTPAAVGPSLGFCFPPSSYGGGLGTTGGGAVPVVVAAVAPAWSVSSTVFASDSGRSMFAGTGVPYPVALALIRYEPGLIGRAIPTSSGGICLSLIAI